MENRKNTGLRKRKLPNDGAVQEQEPSIREMCQALKEMESELQNLRGDNNQLRDELLGKDRQLAETRTLLVDRERKLLNTQTLLDDREQQLAARTLLADRDMSELVKFVVYYGPGNVRSNESGVDLTKFAYVELQLTDPEKMNISQLKHWLTINFSLDPNVCTVSIQSVWTKSRTKIFWEFVPIDRTHKWVTWLESCKRRRTHPVALVLPIPIEDPLVQGGGGYEPGPVSQPIDEMDVARSEHMGGTELQGRSDYGSHVGREYDAGESSQNNGEDPDSGGEADGDEEGSKMQNLMEEEDEDGLAKDLDSENSNEEDGEENDEEVPIPASWNQRLSTGMTVNDGHESSWEYHQSKVGIGGMYMQMYRRSTRVRLVPTAIPGQMQPPGTSDMYPIQSMVGMRHHAVELTEQAEKDIASFIQRVETGPLLPREEHVSWLRRLQENIRGIKHDISCTRSSDVVPRRAAQRPPRHSLDIHDPRPHVSPPRQSLRRQDSRPQVSPPRHSLRRQDPRPHVSPQIPPRPPPPFQPSSSSRQQHQGPHQEEDWLHQQLWQSQPHMWQDTTEGQYMASPGGHTSACSDRSSDVHSNVLGDQLAYHTAYHTGYQTPPPPPTQETQPEVDEPVYGPGLRQVRPRIPLTLSGPRPRRQRTRPHRAE